MQISAESTAEELQLVRPPRCVLAGVSLEKHGERMWRSAEVIGRTFKSEAKHTGLE